MTCLIGKTVNWLSAHGVQAVAAVASLATACIAGLALKTWKKKMVAERRERILDEISECFFSYTQKYLSNSIIQLENIESYLKGKSLEEVKQSIGDDMEGYSKAVIASITDYEKLLPKMKILIAKGKALDIKSFNNINNCLGGIIDMTKEILCIGLNIGNFKDSLSEEAIQRIANLNTKELTKNLEACTKQFTDALEEGYRL